MPDGWKTQFGNNKGNITQDIATTLTIINKTAEDLDGRLTVLEGKEGVLNNADVKVYLAPASDYFDSHSTSQTANPQIYVKHTPTSGGVYYTLNTANPNVDANDYAYCVEVDGEKRIYPGNDNNLENQYRNYKTDELRKQYPLHSLSQAMQFLRRFRAAGAITYYVITQWGDYDYGTRHLDIRLADATAGSRLVIGPNMTEAQRLRLPAAKNTYNYASVSSGNFAFLDSDLVKVRFVWSDDNGYINTAYVNNIDFYDSTTLVIGCGFYLKWKRSSTVYNNVGLSTSRIEVQSGTVTFRHCVFRNCGIAPNLPENPPTIVFRGEPVKVAETPNTSDYKLDNINAIRLPCVFVDDPKPSGVNDSVKMPYIIQIAGDNSTVKLMYPHLVFLDQRNSNHIFVEHASNQLRLAYAPRELSKILVCRLNGQASGTYVFNINYMCTAGSSTSSVNPTDNAYLPEQHFRIEYIDKSLTGAPDSTYWLKQASGVFSNQSRHYDQTTGTYNTITDTLMQNPGIVKIVNAANVTTSLGTRVGFMKNAPSGGTVVLNATEKYVTKGRQYGTLPLATCTGHTFLGWFTEASGGT